MNNLYIETHVSELPEKEGEYFVVKQIQGHELLHQAQYLGGKWDSAQIVRWLRPLPASTVLTDEANKEKILIALRGAHLSIVGAMNSIERELDDLDGVSLHLAVEQIGDLKGIRNDVTDAIKLVPLLSAKPSEIEAVEFAEWVAARYFQTINSKSQWHTKSHPNSSICTTTELYKLFKQDK